MTTCVLYDCYFESATRSLQRSRKNCILCPLRKLLRERFKDTRTSGTESENHVQKSYIYAKICQQQYGNLTSRIRSLTILCMFVQLIANKELVMSKRNLNKTQTDSIYLKRWLPLFPNSKFLEGKGEGAVQFIHEPNYTSLKQYLNTPTSHLPIF